MQYALLSGILGLLLLAETGQGQNQGPKKGARPGEINTPPARGERKTTRLKVGDPAPDFTLEELRTRAKVRLASFKGRQPVVLIFGSYT